MSIVPNRKNVQPKGIFRSDQNALNTAVDLVTPKENFTHGSNKPAASKSETNALRVQENNWKYTAI